METPGNSTRLTLREQQVLRLRREIAHPGGVRLQLRRKDCLGSIALVDAVNAVWYVVLTEINLSYNYCITTIKYGNLSL